MTCCPLKIGVTLIALCVSSLHVTVTALFFINTIISANGTRTTNTLNLWGTHIKKVFKASSLKDFLSLCARLLANFPDVVGLQQLLEVVVLLLSADLSELSVYGIVVGRSLYVADDTKGYGEAVAITHEGELQL